jgi:membrane-associated phospholipid phosphatase
LTCAVAFAVLSAEATSGVPNRLDRAAADLLVASSHGTASFRLAEIVSIGGSPTFIVLAAGTLALLVWSRRRDPRLAALCLVAPAVAGVVQLLVKDLVGPQQPVSFNPLFSDHTTAFPSGHATGAASIAALVVVLAITAVVPRWRRAPVIAVAITYALAVAASRIVLDYHLAQDAVGGLLLGAAVVALTGVFALQWSQPVERHAARSATP